MRRRAQRSTRRPDGTFIPPIVPPATIAAFAALLVAVVAQAEPFTMDAAPDQRVTAMGRAPSLKIVIEDVCWRAGVRVDFYDAGDSPFGRTFRDLPLDVLLTRALSSESFMISAEREGSGRLRWQRVLGDTAVAAKRRGMGGGGNRRRPLDVPPALVRTAFTAEKDDEEREEALQILSARNAGDPRELQAFLATDAGVIAETLDQYPGAADALALLAGRYEEPAIRTKIVEIQGLPKKRRP